MSTQKPIAIIGTKSIQHKDTYNTKFIFDIDNIRGRIIDYIIWLIYPTDELRNEIILSFRNGNIIEFYGTTIKKIEDNI